MANIYINEHILPIFLINFIKTLTPKKKKKNTKIQKKKKIQNTKYKIQKIFQRQFLKNLMSDLAEIQLMIKFSLPFSPQ